MNNGKLSMTFRGVLVTLLFVATAAACGGGDDGGQEGTGGTTGTGTGGNEPEALRPLTFSASFAPTSVELAGVMYALENGYYEEEGIDLEVTPGGGSQRTVQNLDSGGVDVAIVGGVNQIQSVDAGIEIVSIGMQYSKNFFGVIVDSDSEIETLDDLIGRSVITSPGSPETISLPAYFARAGLDYSQVNEVSVDPTAKVSSFLQGMADSVSTASPLVIPFLEAQDRTPRVLYFDDAGVGAPDRSFVTMRSTLEADPELLADFLRATYRGTRDAIDDPEAAVDALLKNFPDLGGDEVKPQLAAQFELATDFICSAGQDGQSVAYHAADEWEAAIELMQEFGGVEGDVQTSDLYTNEFAEDDTVTDWRCGSA